MKIAKGTSPWLAAPLAIALVGFFISFAFPPIWVGLILVVPGLFLFAFMLYFFRDPERPIGKGIISPADGIVTQVRQGPPFYVSIFMNVHNVHVNRMPMDGKIVSVKHIPGGFVPAFNKESDRNERVVTTCQGETRFEMVQIAGAVARRIVPYVKGGETMKKGQRFGMIRLGSRVDLTIDRELKVKVKKGDRVYAGTTTLAEEL